MSWHGIIPVATTPFTADGGAPDLDGYAANLERLVAGGVHGVIALATAGEGPSMSRDEILSVVARAVDVVGGRVPVLAGVGGPNERDTLQLIEKIEGSVDGFMVVTPYFYPLTRTEMLNYFRRIGAATPKPLMIYNSTYANLPLVPDALEELAADIPNFVALKEGNQLQASDVIRRLNGRIGIFTARDLYMHELLATGGAGAIAFAANVVPELVVSLYDAAVKGDLAEARALQDRLNPLIWLLVKRSFPAAIKTAMDLVGAVGGPVRAPLSNVDESEREALRAALAELGVLAG